MQAGYLVLLLLATSAAKASHEEPANQLRVAKDFDSFDTESEEEPKKRSFSDWFTRTHTDFGKTIVEQELEVEVPLKEELVVQIPPQIEAPSLNCPYSVELKLSVPESTKHPIKTEIPFPEVYQVETLHFLERPHHYYPAKKPEFSPYASFSDRLYPSKPFHFTHPVKMEFIEPSPFVTGIKSPLEVQFDERNIYKSEVYPYSKIGYANQHLFAKPHTSYVPYEEEHIINTHPSHLYYPKHLPGLVEETITPFDLVNFPYEKEHIIKTHPSHLNYPKHLPTLLEKPISSFDWINSPYEKEQLINTYPSHLNYPKHMPTHLTETITSRDLLNSPYEKEHLIKTYPSHLNYPKHLPGHLKETIASRHWLNNPYEKEHLIKTNPSQFYYPKQSPLLEKHISSFDWVNGPYEKQKIFNTHPSSFYHPQSLSAVMEEQIVVGKHFNKHHPKGKTHFGSHGSKYY